MEMNLKEIEKEEKFYFDSMSSAIVGKMHEGFGIGQDVWEKLKKDQETCVHLFEKMPSSFLDEKLKLAKIILKKQPAKFSSLVKLSTESKDLQAGIYAYFKEIEKPIT